MTRASGVPVRLRLAPAAKAIGRTTAVPMPTRAKPMSAVGNAGNAIASARPATAIVAPARATVRRLVRAVILSARKRTRVAASVKPEKPAAARAGLAWLSSRRNSGLQSEVPPSAMTPVKHMAAMAAIAPVKAHQAEARLQPLHLDMADRVGTRRTQALSRDRRQRIPAVARCLHRPRRRPAKSR